MANQRTRHNSPTYQIHQLLSFLFLTTLIKTDVLCSQYKVGDLDAWGIPTESNPLLYAKWSKYHTFNIGDSLLFLYPPSQDSVIQVTAKSYATCDLKDPILYMNNGNSLFNITSEGELFFVSGQKGHCEKKQKLHILVGNVTSTVLSPTYGPTEPLPPSSSSLSSSLNFQVIVAVFIGFVVCRLIAGTM